MKRERYLLLPVSLMVSVALSLWATISLAELADTPWPKFRHDAQNTGQSPYLGAQTNTLKWKFVTGGSMHFSGFYSSPAIGADGTLYIGSDDGGLYAINPNGTKKWRYSTGDWMRSSPAIGANGTIYVGSYATAKGLYAINPNGTMKWKFLAGSYINSSPAIGSDGTIYVGSDDHYLYAINPNGTKKWKFLTGGSINSSPAIGADGTIYVGSMDYYFYAINPDGTMKWRYPTADIGSSPAIGADGTIYVGSMDYYLYAINPDGTMKWRFLTAGQISRSSPAIGSDGTIYVGSFRGLYAINPDGTEKWRFLTRDEISSAPAIGSDGTIYVGVEFGYYFGGGLYAINPDGTEKWYFLNEGGFSSPAIGSDGTIYVGSALRPWPSSTITYYYGFLYAIGEGGGCSLESITKDQSKLDLYREFRNKALSQTKKGKEYTNLYYQHSSEVTSLLLKDSRLRSQATRLLDRAIPEIRLILGGKANDLAPALKNEILSFLGKISQKGSPGLKADIEKLVTDITEGRTKEILQNADPLAGSFLPKNLALFSLLWPLGIPLAFVVVKRRLRLG